MSLFSANGFNFTVNDHLHMDPFFSLTEVTAPTERFLDDDEVKLHLRVDHNSDDLLIDTLIIAAERVMQLQYGVQLVSATYDLFMDAFPHDVTIRPSISPLVSVTTLKYTDTSEAVQTLVENTDYDVDTDAQPSRIYPSFNKIWPTTLSHPKSVEIRIVVGYADAASVPAPFKAAGKLMIGHWYRNREQIITGRNLKVTEIPRAVQTLLATEQVEFIA